MDYIKQWTLNICLTLIVAVVFSVLSPKGNMGKYFKIIIALFITVSFIYPFSNGAKNFNFDFSAIEEFVQESNIYDDTYASLIESNINSLLNTNGYKSCNIDCKLRIIDNEIYVESICVAIPDEYDAEEIRGLILNNLGFKVQVKYIGQ